MVQRYEYQGGHLHKRFDGEYVLHKDYEKLLECRSILRQAVSSIAHESVNANTKEGMKSVATHALNRSIDNSGI